MVSIAVERNGMERRIATFPYFNKDADKMMQRLEARGISACLAYPEGGYNLACTSEYLKQGNAL